ncbi:MAG: cysteine peptidase family C39 domain-containing protein, partial [Candidatus Omnitrophota bacterium]
MNTAYTARLPEETQEKKPEFKSSFKTWIRVVAFIIVAVFLPEQVAQAVEYDWRVLWNKPATGSIAPTYLKDIRQIDIPLAVRNILKDLAGKPVNAIKISPTLTVEFDKPLNISKARIEEIYEWLKGRPCGSKAMFDFLTYAGIKAEEQDIAVFALTMDILNGAVKPEGNPKIIKNSIFSLAKTAEFFGVKLYPVKITDFSLSAKSITPFIAHVNGDHFILVTKVTADKVYFSDQHKEEFLPLEKFLEKFTGFALVTKPSVSVQLLGKEEALGVLGAGDWGQTYNAFTDEYKNRDNINYNYNANNRGSAGYTTSSNASTPLNITQNVYNNPVTFTVNLYGANQMPSSSYQTIYGTASQYQVTQQWNKQGQNYSATSSVGMNQWFNKPVEARYSNGILTEARYGNNVMTANNAAFQNLPVTGNIWDKVVYTSPVVSTAEHKAVFDTNLDKRINGDGTTLWVGKTVGDLNFSTNLSNNSFKNINVKDNLPRWNWEPYGNVMQNPERANDYGIPPVGAPTPYNNVFKATPVGDAHLGLFQINPNADGNFTINFTRTGLHARAGDMIDVGAYAPDAKINRAATPIIGFVKNLTIQPLSATSTLYLNPAVETNRSLTFYVTNSRFDNAGRGDLRYVMANNQDYMGNKFTQVGAIDLSNKNWSIANDQYGLPNVDHLVKSTNVSVGGTYGTLSTYTSEGSAMGKAQILDLFPRTAQDRGLSSIGVKGNVYMPNITAEIGSPAADLAMSSSKVDIQRTIADIKDHAKFTALLTTKAAADRIVLGVDQNGLNFNPVLTNSELRAVDNKFSLGINEYSGPKNFKIKIDNGNITPMAGANVTARFYRNLSSDGIGNQTFLELNKGFNYNYNGKTWETKDLSDTVNLSFYGNPNIKENAEINKIKLQGILKLASDGQYSLEADKFVYAPLKVDLGGSANNEKNISNALKGTAGREFVTSEIGKYTYLSKSSTGAMQQVALLGVDNKTFRSNLNTNPMFENVTHNFKDFKSTEFVSGLQFDKGRIIAISRDNEKSLEGAKATLNAQGYVATAGYKSGWADMQTLATYYFKDDAGKIKVDAEGKTFNATAGKMLLKDVNFWVTNGGENFNTFSVGKAIIGNNDVKINIHKDNGKPVIEIVEKQPLILSQLPGAGKL